MKIELKSNRKGIIKLIFPFVIVFIFLTIMAIVALSLDYETIKKDIGYIIVIIILCCVSIAILLLTLLLKRKKYIFGESEIIIYHRNGFLLNKIQIADIERMHYRKFKWRYIVTIFFGELMNGGAYKIHVSEKNGNKHELGFINVKDAKKLKEMYADLLILHV